MALGALPSNPRAGRVVAVLHATTADQVVAQAKALVAGGLRCLEITLRASDALDAIERLAVSFGDDVSVGAGTVTNIEQATAAVTAGADFLVSPGLAIDVLQWSQARDVLAIPGILTPTEAMSARAAGARIVKLFPASWLGPRYLRELLGPFPDLQLMPTGGIDIETVPEYLAAGAIAVGVGRPLLGDVAHDGDLAKLERRARRLADLVASSSPAHAR